MNSPIYKDFYYTADTASLEYYIVTEDMIIFRGKVWRNPDTGIVTVHVGDIIRDYLRFDLPDFRPMDRVVTRQEDAYRVFELYSSNGTKLDEYKVLFDWYGEWNGETKVLSNPIDGVLDPRMKILWTIYGQTAANIEVDIFAEGENTFFNLLTKEIRVPYYGATVRMDWYTNYTPYSDIKNRYFDFFFPSNDGCSVVIPALYDPFTTWEYDVDIYYKSYRPENYLDSFHVVREAAYFNISTPTLSFPKEGGTGRISWTTNIPQNMLSYTIGFVGTISDMNEYGCRVTVAENDTYLNYNFDINFYMKYNNGASNFLVGTVHVTLDGETPEHVTGQCSSLYPLLATQYVLPTVTKSYPIEVTGWRNFVVGLVCEEECPYRLVPSDNWVSFVSGETNGYYFKEWDITMVVDDIPSGVDERTTNVEIYRKSDNILLRTAQIIQRSENYSPAFTYNIDGDVQCYSTIFPEKRFPNGTGVVGAFWNPDNSLGAYYKGTKTSCIYPLNIIRGNGLNSFDINYTITIPSSVNVLSNVIMGPGVSLLRYEGTRSEWTRVKKSLYEGNTAYSNYWDIPVECSDGYSTYDAMAPSTLVGFSGQTCSSCHSLYYFEKNTGNTSSRVITYYAESLVSAHSVYDVYGIAMEPVSHTFVNKVGTLTYSRAPFRLGGKSGVTYSSESVRWYQGVWNPSHNLPMLVFANKLIVNSGETFSHKNIEHVVFDRYHNGLDCSIIIPNARALELALNRSFGNNVRIFAPNVEEIEGGIYDASELTIGGRLRNFLRSDPVELTDINFCGTTTEFVEWFNGVGADNNAIGLFGMTSHTIHCLNGTKTVNNGQILN